MRGVSVVTAACTYVQETHGLLVFPLQPRRVVHHMILQSLRAHDEPPVRTEGIRGGDTWLT